MEPRVAILGIPSDNHSSFLRGAAGAPPIVRREMFGEQGNPYTELGVDLRSPDAIVDIGDVALDESESDLAAIEAAVLAQLRLNRRLLSIGGDHFVTYPILRAYAAHYGPVSIVHFDAHPDMYPSFQGDRFSHACPFARILEDGLALQLVQIGIRTMSPPQRTVAEQYGVHVFAPWQVHDAYRMLPRGNVYVSLDLDGLDPAYAPGVSHREPGGLSVRDVLEIVKAIPGDVVGADVVEYNPKQDLGGVTAAVAAKFAREFIGRMYAR